MERLYWVEFPVISYLTSKITLFRFYFKKEGKIEIQ